MKKLILLLFLAPILFTGCGNEEPVPKRTQPLKVSFSYTIQNYDVELKSTSTGNAPLKYQWFVTLEHNRIAPFGSPIDIIIDDTPNNWTNNKNVSFTLTGGGKLEMTLFVMDGVTGYIDSYSKSITIE
ncbi:MAG: hypothetical protein LBS50_08655 [Prevotellaceae bacterium]|jgi:hypothetical protein|nr:hypothetical protein [Prevotellaceae bacterium]